MKFQLEIKHISCYILSQPTWEGEGVYPFTPPAPQFATSQFQSGNKKSACFEIISKDNAQEVQSVYYLNH